jgi:hypothetical protein
LLTESWSSFIVQPPGVNSSSQTWKLPIRNTDPGSGSSSCTVETDLLHCCFIVDGLKPPATNNQDRRQVMKLDQAIQFYKEYHRMNSGKKHDPVLRRHPRQAL